ncbi:hypothetical protein [Adhaeribacter pallidiroseus]|uniref:Uncharacterized protein n=1 Tax=Adhaeribacter pallidiroseus TaxID=2072847 RepID=A0A369QLZ4_9BACT|nr:hypothetical protein [Adhaeribacter pallidiroseus]RDC63268.1 hypothetical protein AHMF7616_01870 [Adhaeribacter pallidiroseus]
MPSNKSTAKQRKLRHRLQVSQLTKRFRKVLSDVELFKKGKLETTPVKDFLGELEEEIKTPKRRLTLEELITKDYGERGTPERERIEAILEKDLAAQKRKEIRKTRNQTNNQPVIRKLQKFSI